MIIGGASVYNEMMDMCDKLYVTKVDHEFFGDTFIRNIDANPNFKVVWSSDEYEEKGLKFRFVEYRRKLVEQ